MADFWSGKTVVVTGAAQGQGAEEAGALFDLGAHVIAVDIHDAQSESWSAVRSRLHGGFQPFDHPQARRVG
ncbi:hypothetical protein SAMN05446935_7328 [Burkholderia sp. YR290]|nr:hypothetical protein SAMN05446935_7328 [Burkholderia sp. YR290]